ncbi:MAG: NAD(P)H-binding protein [Hamadaea sp.]|uniref:NAD(P)H-binding protein n=1 Tax=Hamadaea sp. TaxID=2024425 RepID=UPI001832C846|nr:NAD(P)H-binding protein [Hamadaea sp.]NUR71029.1 NAD(P)H-binding protein [Hamadaea sp.]NUT23710.1 NAD(P)H-binding protein [Hamadaea sp.]
MKIAITGSTGRVGGRVAQRLLESSTESVAESQIVRLTRRDAPYEDVSALRAALKGVDTLVFVSSDGEAARMIAHHQNVLQAAADAGVGHVVLLSGLDSALDSPFCYAYTNGFTEQMLRGSGLGYSIARAGLFAEFFGGLVRQVAADGTVRLPTGGCSVSLVARDDVADCLAALALAGPTNRHHDLTGEQSLSGADVAAAAGYAFEECPEAEFAASLTLGGEEPWWVYAYTSMFAAIRQNRWSAVSDEVNRLLGRPAARI